MWVTFRENKKGIYIYIVFSIKQPLAQDSNCFFFRSLLLILFTLSLLIFDYFYLILLLSESTISCETNILNGKIYRSRCVWHHPHIHFASPLWGEHTKEQMFILDKEALFTVKANFSYLFSTIATPLFLQKVSDREMRVELNL